MSGIGFKTHSVILLVAALLVAELLWSRTALALDPKKAIGQYSYSVWTTEHGLPSNTIQAITQTRDGYLWLATEDGLARFDGVRFTVFNNRNTEAIKSSGISALFEDREGNLWIGTGGGLLRFKDGTFTVYTTKDGLAHDEVGAIHQDHQGGLWLGTPLRLSRFKDGKFTTYSTREDGRFDLVDSIYEDRAGILWFGTQNGLLRFQDGKFVRYTTKEGLSHDLVRAICQDREGNLWIGTDGGLNRFADGIFTRYTTKEGLSNDRVYSVYEDREGNLWVGTYGGGLLRLKDGRFETFTTKEGLSDDRVLAIYEDREGSLWIATRGGLNRLKDQKVITYTAEDGLSDDWTYVVYEDRQGAVWIGTRGGLTKIKDGKFTTYTTKDGLSHNSVRAILEDRKGNLWIGTDGGGLNRFKNGRLTVYTTRDGLTSDRVFSLHEDRDGALWIGTYGGWVTLFKDGRFTAYTKKDGLEVGRARAITGARDGNLWIGGTGVFGLSRFKDGKFTSYPIKGSASSNPVMSIYGDREGTLWIGTYGMGLIRFQDGKFTFYTTSVGLLDDVVYQVLDDDRGNFWMSSNKGIFRVSKRELDDLAAGRIKSVTYVAYGKADGMKSVECNGGSQPAGWKTRDGRLWFPTTAGVVIVDPHRIEANSLPPPVEIEQVVVDKAPVALGERFEFPPGTRDFEFHYTALSFLDPAKVKFKYKLEGYDGDWVNAETRRAAYYTNLPPGSYRFRVIACNNEGVWNEVGASLDFSLKPHVYQRKLFYALLALILASLGPSVYFLRVRQLKARQRELALIVDQRTKDLVEAKRQLEEINQTLEQRVADGVKALMEAERMAAYGHLVAGVAHEVRHPIFALQTAAYLLKAHLGNREQALEQLQVIEQETKRMADLMRDLLEFARPRALELAPADLRQLLQEVVDTYRAEHDPTFPDIVLVASLELPPVVVDRSRLVQVLVNVIQNAAEHARGLTTVTVSADVVAGAPHVGEGTSELCIRVKDDGAGIPPDHLPRIFDPFFTTGQGTGLGLAIVRRVIKEHGGVIHVESELGKGTLFRICLPIKTAEVAETAEKTLDVRREEPK